MSIRPARTVPMQSLGLRTLTVCIATLKMFLPQCSRSFSSIVFGPPYLYTFESPILTGVSRE